MKDQKKKKGGQSLTKKEAKAVSDVMRRTMKNTPLWMEIMLLVFAGLGIGLAVILVLDMLGVFDSDESNSESSPPTGAPSPPSSPSPTPSPSGEPDGDGSTPLGFSEITSLVMIGILAFLFLACGIYLLVSRVLRSRFYVRWLARSAWVILIPLIFTIGALLLDFFGGPALASTILFTLAVIVMIFYLIYYMVLGTKRYVSRMASEAQEAISGKVGEMTQPLTETYEGYQRTTNAIYDTVTAPYNYVSSWWYGDTMTQTPAGETPEI